jgi:hypothetical protein
MSDVYFFYFRVDTIGAFFEREDPAFHGFTNHYSSYTQAFMIFDCNDDGYPDFFANGVYELDLSSGPGKWGEHRLGAAVGLPGAAGGAPSGRRGIGWGDVNNE